MRILIVGHGRCGKDEAGTWFDKHTSLRYGGSTSLYLAPYVAKELGQDVEQCYLQRHEFREQWYAIGKRARAERPGIFVEAAWQHGDIAAGVRDLCEVQYAAKACDKVIWIARKVSVDPTVDFTVDDCVEACMDGVADFEVIFNHLGLDSYHATLHLVAEQWGVLNE